MSEEAVEQQFAPTPVVMKENNNKGEVLEKDTKSQVDTKVTATKSIDDDDESFAPSVVDLMSDEIKDAAFVEKVQKVVAILRKELPAKHKTLTKHFCAYICWRLESREGISYNPTNTNQKVSEISNLNTYRHWFLKKVGLPQNIYDQMEKGGYGKHWRTYIQDNLAEETTNKIRNTIDMFPTWLAESKGRKKTKKDDTTHSAAGDSSNKD